MRAANRCVSRRERRWIGPATTWRASVPTPTRACLREGATRPSESHECAECASTQRQRGRPCRVGDVARQLELDVLTQPKRDERGALEEKTSGLVPPQRRERA